MPPRPLAGRPRQLGQLIELALNTYGKRLLKARRRLPAMLTTTGPARLTTTITFIYKRSRSKQR